MAQPNNRRNNLPNINITKDAEGNQYIRTTIRPFGSITLIGRLGSDVEVSNVGTDGKARGRFSFAVDWQDYREEDRTVGWVSVTAWNGAAEMLARTVKKGEQLSITVYEWTTLVIADAKGRIQLNDKDEPRIYTEVTVDDIKLLGNPRRNERNTQLNVEDDEDGSGYDDYAPPPQELDDIPF